jgi:hypothetical protein
MYSRNRRYRARSWVRWGIVYAAGVLALAGAGLVIEVAAGSHPRENFSPPSAVIPPWASGSPGSASPSPSPALQGPLQVIQGRQLINGVYLGFPHSAGVRSLLPMNSGARWAPPSILAVLRRSCG